MTDKITITIEKVDGHWTVSGNTSDGKTPLVATASELWDAQQYVDTYIRLFNHEEENEKAAKLRLARDPGQYYPCDAPYCAPGQPTAVPVPPFVPTCQAECVPDSPPETPSEN